MKIKTIYYLICILLVLCSCTTVQKEKRKEAWVRSHLPTMVTVEGGTFLFEGGANGAEEVYVPTFQIADTEVTTELYGNISKQKYLKKRSKYPCSYIVSIKDAVRFCNTLSQIYGYTPCYEEDKDTVICDFTANGFRLPTNEEWEFAAKGGTKSKGYIYSGSNDIDEVAWYGETDINKDHKVAQKKPNELGLYDMSGNVSELCWTNQSFKKNKLFFRGGSFIHPEEFSRVSYPVSYLSDNDIWVGKYGEVYGYSIGFRICRTVTEKEENK